uniref:Uncharacterized protein n=1 Tax=Norrisiella sphaerica TaxID=552664 RepID=A0A7S2QRY9_9EUKA|mmetsp:Transcript_1586/g.2261  ORF Transcript_1586/g.2261 Transcript_1586/m.2261 type:complete len:505 (+) Transcript_1586:127-1641(+)
MSRFARSTLLHEASVDTAEIKLEDSENFAKTVSDPFSVLPRRDIIIARNTDELHLAGKDIEVLEGFEKLTNLQSLWLNDNKIEDIKHLDHCFGLKLLRLQNNKIKSLKGCLRRTKFMEVLCLANNKIRDLGNTLSYLSHLAYIKNLDLSGNPLCEELNYRIRVINALPSLKVLDNHEITAQEYMKAKKLGPYLKTQKETKQPPHLPFQRAGPKRVPFQNKGKPLFSDLNPEANKLKRRNGWFKSASDGNVELMRSMYTLKMNINALDPKSNLPALTIATLSGALGCVKFLLKKKADPNYVGESGISAIHVAASENRTEILKLLVADKRTNLGLKTKENKSAYDLAVEAKHRECKVMLAKAQNLLFHDENAPPMYNFTTSLFWDDERVGPQVKERFSDFEEEESPTHILVEDVNDFVDSLMLRIKPDSKSIEELRQKFEKKIPYKELVSHLKRASWKPVPIEKRKQWAMELYESSKKIASRAKDEADVKKALKLANHAAFLETQD